MSTRVYSIRVPKKLKDEIESIENVNWQEETRAFLEWRVRKERITLDLESAKKNREKMKKELDVAKLIREDREQFH
jgi:hypothetical protein